MTRPQLSVQLYTLRDRLDDLPALAAELAQIGFTRVEPHRWHENPTEVRAALDGAGLSAPSAHARILDADPHQVFSAAVELGVKTVVQPNAARELWHSQAGVASLAEKLNEAAEIGREYGVGVGYHNHAFEFLESEWIIGAANEERPTALDFLAADLDEGVALEIDTYWAAVGGADPVALLKRLGFRVTLLHIKDGPITPDAINQTPVGGGAMPVDQILAAAPHARPVIELDDYRGDALDAVRESYEYLIGRL